MEGSEGAGHDSGEGGCVSVTHPEHPIKALYGPAITMICLFLAPAWLSSAAITHASILHTKLIIARDEKRLGIAFLNLNKFPLSQA